LKFCTKCGNEITNEKLFCSYCGNDLREETTTDIKSIEDNNSPTITPVETSTSNTKISKNSKLVIVLIAVLIISLIVIIKIGNSLSDPSKLVTRFEKDVASNNASDLATIIYSDEPNLKVDSKSIAPLLSYFKSTPAYLSEVMRNLKDDALSPKDIKNLSTKSRNTLTLAKDGKNFLIFPKYKINIKPSSVKITSTIKDVTYSINNIQIGKSDTANPTKEFGPYIPGNYSILANYTGKYVTLNKSYPVDLVSANNDMTELSVFDDMNYLNITSDNPDAEIYVNGKDTNVRVKDATQFGPIESSSKIYATYIENGRTLKSEEYTVATGDTELYLGFENATNDLNDVQTQLKDLLSNYASYFVMAVNTNNISLIDPYVTSGSNLYKAQQSFIPTTYSNGIKEEILSTNITKYNISDDNKSGSITTSEVYNIIAKDGTSSNKTSNFVYTFQYIDSTSSYQLTTINRVK